MADPIENANPETAAVTGGVPPAAEPPPMTRGRAASRQGSTFLLIILGIALLITALVADQESDGAIGMAIMAAALIAIAVMSVTGFLGPALVAFLGFVAGVLCTILAFSADDFGYPQLVLLVAGATTFIASFASLAARRRPGRGDEEPSPGVENI